MSFQQLRQFKSVAANKKSAIPDGMTDFSNLAAQNKVAANGGLCCYPVAVCGECPSMTIEMTKAAIKKWFLETYPEIVEFGIEGAA